MVLPGGGGDEGGECFFFFSFVCYRMTFSELSTSETKDGKNFIILRSTLGKSEQLSARKVRGITCVESSLLTFSSKDLDI